MPLLLLFKTIGVTVVIYGIYSLLGTILREVRSPVRRLPGPSNPNYLLGNLGELLTEDIILLHERWTKSYGKTMKYNNLLSIGSLYTSDLRAIHHVLTNTDIYDKPPYAAYLLHQVAGAGVLTNKGPENKKQRRIMNPAFGTSHIRDVIDVFLNKSYQLRGSMQEASTKQSGPIDILPLIARMTLDVIGLAGFDCDFDSFNPQKSEHELNKGLATIFHSKEPNIWPFLQAFIPILRILPATHGKTIRRVQKILFGVGKNLIATAKDSHEAKATGNKKDIISLLIRANMAADPSQRLTDNDIVAQVPTLLVAGHETSSASIAWILFRISSHPAVQSKLRDELFTIDTEDPTYDQLAGLTYLDSVVRETLRIHATIPIVPRQAFQDDILPLEHPVTDRNGIQHQSLRLSKGQIVMIPIAGVNTDKSLWGEDAHQFRPERWEKLPEMTREIPAAWANLLTFFAGPRSCIGMRFAIAEIKAVIFTLIRTFELELAVPQQAIVGKSGILQYPMVKDDPTAGAQLPLHIRPFKDR